MSLDAGSVYATLGGRFNRSGFVAFDSAMHKSSRSVDVFERGMGRSMSRSSRALHSMGRAATQAAGLGAAGGVLALGYAMVGTVKKAADFEAQLSSLASVSGANGRQMESFKKQALDAGAATKYSALQAAEAQTELAKGGMSVRDIIGGGLKGALGLAAAGELDLAAAAAYTANAMNLFGLQGNQATHVADALASAANRTTADVGDFGMALTQGGSAAKAAGLSFDQTIAALEALASIGVKGSDAGTSLKAALTQLASPTKQSAGLMEELGLKFFDAHGKMKPVADIAGMLRERLGGLTKEQRLQAATTLVGTDGMRALLALYDAGPRKIKDFEQGLARHGTAAEVAAKKQDNLKGKLENLQGSLETAAIVIGTEMIPVLQDAAVDLTDFVNRAAASGDIKHLGEDLASGLRTAIGAVPDIVHGIGQIGSTAGDAIGTVSGLVNALGGIDTVGPALLGAVAGFAAFRVVAAITPTVIGLATALGDVALAARAGGAAFAASTLISMVNPVTAVAVAFVALGAALALAAGQESYEERIARQSAEAKRAQADAVRALGEAERSSADATLSARRADIEHERAVAHFNQVRKTATKGSLEYRDAQLRVRETAAQAAEAHRREAGETKKRVDAAKEEVGVAERRERTTAKELALQQKLNRTSGGDRNPAVIDATKRHEEALRRLESANLRAAISEINYQRALQGAGPVHRKNAVAIHDLFALYNHLPKRVVTALMATDENAVGKIGRLAVKLAGLGKRRTVARILASSDTAEEAIRRLQRYLNSLRDKNITVTTTERRVIKGSPSMPSARGHATGHKTRGPEVALIGEGAAPEYVIPTEPRFRGRGVELWMQAGHDLGIPGFRAGVRKPGAKPAAPAAKKKPPKRFIPKPRDPLRLPVEDIEHQAETAKGKYQDEQNKVQDLERTANQKRTKSNTAERARARAKLPAAKRLRDKLHAIYKQRQKEAKEARRYQNAIKEQEQLVEIARGQMELADKNDDQHAYETAKGRRATALTALETLIDDAQKHVKKGSDYYNQLQIELGQLALDQKDLADAANQPEQAATDPFTLTPEQQAQLDQLEAGIALAELTPTLEDDKAAVGALTVFREGILSSLQQRGAPSGAIRDAARDVKSARDELAGLAGGGTSSASVADNPDLQAQLDQERQRRQVTDNALRLSEAALATFGPAGSTPPGSSGNALTVNVNSLVPPNRQWIDEIGRLATDGQGSQGYRQAPRERIGV